MALGVISCHAECFECSKAAACTETLNSTVDVTQGQALGNGSIISAMETNVQLMDIQIRLVQELTALQASMQPAILTCPVMHL